jgi:acetyl-CoA synthetase
VRFCKNYITVGDRTIEGALDYRRIINNYSAEFLRPQGEDKTVVTDPMLIYFSSGTSGMPKMVRHDYSSPLGQINYRKILAVRAGKQGSPDSD